VAVNVKIAELMHTPLMSLSRHQSAGHARDLMAEHGVSALPVLGGEGEAVGIVTSTDLLDNPAGGRPVSQIMASPALSVPPTEGPHVAARIMRNHNVHHVVVVDRHEPVGMLSSYDLLLLVEDHRFTMKQPPTPSKKKNSRQ
jgi:CBS domain-containing protein